MNEWEAKYKALVAGIEDKALIDNAERLVGVAAKASCASGYSFGCVFCAMLGVIGLSKSQLLLPKKKKIMTDKKRLKTLFDGFRIEYEENEDSLLCKEGSARIGGYAMFYTVFEFDRKGVFTKMGAYE